MPSGMIPVAVVSRKIQLRGVYACKLSSAPLRSSCGTAASAFFVAAGLPPRAHLCSTSFTCSDCGAIYCANSAKGVNYHATGERKI
jgi:hypothetical protein